MGCASSKGLQQDDHHQQQQQQQQHPQADRVLHILLSTDPASPNAKDMLRLFHGVCRHGRAAALRTIPWVSLDYCERARPDHRKLYLLAAADRANCLYVRENQVSGLVRALLKQQQQQQGGGVRQLLKLLAPWKRASIASSAPTMTSVGAISSSRSSSRSSSIGGGAASGATPYATNQRSMVIPGPYSSSTTSSSAAQSANVTRSSAAATTSTTIHRASGTAAKAIVRPIIQQGPPPWAPPAGPQLAYVEVTGKPTRRMAQHVVQLLDALPAASCLESLVLGFMWETSWDEQRQPSCNPFLDSGDSTASSQECSAAPGGSWRDSCESLFMGRQGYRVQLEDLVLMLGHLRQLRSLCGLRVDLSGLQQHAGFLQGLEELELEKPLGLEQQGVVEALAGCTTLRRLVVRGCDLERLPAAIPALVHLSSLDLSNTDVCEEVVQVVCFLTGLQQLDLSRAPCLTDLPDSISRLASLHRLSLWDSQVTILPTSMTAMSSLRELAWGQPFKEEGLHSLHLHVVWRLTNLHTLALSNAVTRVSFGLGLMAGLGQLTGLSALMLAGESLQFLPDSLSRLVGLERLTISAGRMTTLPAVVMALTQLTELVLDCEQLHQLAPAVQAFVDQRRKQQGSSSE